MRWTKQFELISCFFYLTGQHYTWVLSDKNCLVGYHCSFAINRKYANGYIVRFTYQLRHAQIRIVFPLEYIIIGIFVLCRTVEKCNGLYTLFSIYIVIRQQKNAFCLLFCHETDRICPFSLFSILWKKSWKSQVEKTELFYSMKFFSLTK